MSIHLKISSGFRGKKPKRRISLFLSSPKPQMGGRSLLWCWSEAELLLCRSQHLCSSCLWGSSAISTPSLGFSRGHNLPVSHSVCSPSALLKEWRHFQRSQRASLAWLDIYTGMLLSEGREMAFSAGKPEHSEFCFLFESFRAHFLRPIHNLKITLFINSLTNPNCSALHLVIDVLSGINNCLTTSAGQSNARA